MDNLSKQCVNKEILFSTAKGSNFRFINNLYKETDGVTMGTSPTKMFREFPFRTWTYLSTTVFSWYTCSFICIICSCICYHFSKEISYHKIVFAIDTEKRIKNAIFVCWN